MNLRKMLEIATKTNAHTTARYFKPFKYLRKKTFMAVPILEVPLDCLCETFAGPNPMHLAYQACIGRFFIQVLKNLPSQC